MCNIFILLPVYKLYMSCSHQSSICTDISAQPSYCSILLCSLFIFYCLFYMLFRYFNLYTILCIFYYHLLVCFSSLLFEQCWREPEIYDLHCECFSGLLCTVKDLNTSCEFQQFLFFKLCVNFLERNAYTCGN